MSHEPYNLYHANSIIYNWKWDLSEKKNNGWEIDFFCSYFKYDIRHTLICRVHPKIFQFLDSMNDAFDGLHSK